MTRLAFAIAFLSVFGLVGYSLVVLLAKIVSKNEKEAKKEEDK